MLQTLAVLVILAAYIPTLDSASWIRKIKFCFSSKFYCSCAIFHSHTLNIVSFVLHQDKWKFISFKERSGQLSEKLLILMVYVLSS